MLAVFRSPRTWAVVIGLVVVLVVVVVVATSDGGEDEAGDEITAPHRGPDTPIVIPADEPIVIGLSAALTGPTETQGTESRDATVVGVERGAVERGERRPDQGTRY